MVVVLESGVTDEGLFVDEDFVMACSIMLPEIAVENQILSIGISDSKYAMMQIN